MTTKAKTEMKRKRNSYEAGFKLRVVELAEINGNSKAARENMPGLMRLGNRSLKK